MADVIGYEQLVVDHVVKHLLSIGIVKRDEACKQLIDDRAKYVKVNCLRVPCFLDHFGGQVSESPAKRIRVFVLHIFFRQTEICEDRMAF